MRDAIQTAEMLALQKRTIGNNALELLVSMGEHGIITVGFSYMGGQGQMKSPTYTLIPTQSLEEDSIVPDHVFRITPAIDALIKRGFVVPLDEQEINKALEISTQYSTNDDQRANIRKIRDYTKRSSTRSRIEMFEISTQGMQALEEASKRVEKFKRDWIHKKYSVKYVITGKIDFNNDRLQSGVQGFYRQSHIVGQRVIIEINAEENNPENYDPVVKSAMLNGKRITYIERQHIVFFDADQQMFDELRTKTLEYDRAHQQAQDTRDREVQEAEERLQSKDQQINKNWLKELEVLREKKKEEQETSEFVLDMENEEDLFKP